MGQLELERKDMTGMKGWQTAGYLEGQCHPRKKNTRYLGILKCSMVRSRGSRWWVPIRLGDLWDLVGPSSAATGQK